MRNVEMSDAGEGNADKARRAAAAKVKADRKAIAGLSRTLKLRLYPTSEQAERINRTIGTNRFVWNRLWLPMLNDAARARAEAAKAAGARELRRGEEADPVTQQAWREAWRKHPDPTETQYNRARMAAARGEFPWIAEALQTPLTRAARTFAAGVRDSRGRKADGSKRKVKAGRVQPRHRRDDACEGLEWQLQGKAPLGGQHLGEVVLASTVKVPGLGEVRYSDKGHLLRRYLEAGTVEACEITVKRDGPDYYACIAVRGLQPAPAHPQIGSAVGLDMGVANPITTSDGEFVTHHQGHAIKDHLARLERKKLRAKRDYARKLRAAAKRAGALTETGAFKKGVRIEHSNRMRRLNVRLGKIDRQIAGYRADWQRNKALEIVRGSEIVVVEALTLKNMTRSAAGTAEKPGRNVRAKAGLNRAILARGFGSLRQRLKHKAEELGGTVIEVDPAYTSQTCPSCEHVSAENRKTQAQFACVECGHNEHADVVGATNILSRGMSPGAPPGAGRGGHATSSPPQGGDAERAGDPSNKPSREPDVSLGTKGSRGAKPHVARRQPPRSAVSHTRRGEPQQPGSRSDAD